MVAQLCWAAPKIQSQSPAQQIQNQSSTQLDQSQALIQNPATIQSQSAPTTGAQSTPTTQSQSTPTTQSQSAPTTQLQFAPTTQLQSAPTIQPQSAATPSLQQLQPAQAIQLRPAITNSSRSSSNNATTSATPNTVPTDGSTTSPKEPTKLETFFQLTGGQRNPDTSDSPSSTEKKKAGADSAALSTPDAAHNKSTANFLWHVLDNIGVPISKGNHDPSMDPRIKEKMSIPPYKNTASLNSNSATQENPFMPPGQGAPTTTHKIPESELQGVDPILQKDESSK
ncbi:MAG TPA: hypothetical protein V6C76_15285 [Drouetiella sp.]